MTHLLLSQLDIIVADRRGGAGDIDSIKVFTTVTVDVVDVNDNLPFFTSCVSN